VESVGNMGSKVFETQGEGGAGMCLSICILVEGGMVGKRASDGDDNASGFSCGAKGGRAMLSFSNKPPTGEVRVQPVGRGGGEGNCRSIGGAMRTTRVGTEGASERKWLQGVLGGGDERWGITNEFTQGVHPLRKVETKGAELGKGVRFIAQGNLTVAQSLWSQKEGGTRFFTKEECGRGSGGGARG